MEEEKYIVEFENARHHFWLAPWEGDPGRTLLKCNAQQFDTKDDAQFALDEAIRKNYHRTLIGEVIPYNGVKDEKK